MEEALSFQHLITNHKEKQVLLEKKDTCDKYDYLAAVACGSLGGIIDVFLVGAPNSIKNPTSSKIQNLTDEQVDSVVKKFSRMVGWTPTEGKEDNVASAIGFLEKKYKINYDQRHSGDVNNLFKMSAKDHHLKSLGHSPDILGLFFSILNQFTGTSTFVSEGKLINFNCEKQELRGGNLVTKLFCGVTNWFGHIMSDIAGSSGGRGNGSGRGSGIAIPFYELFQFADFGKFSVENDKHTLAELSDRVFKSGYDFRFGLTMSIPLIITELLTRLIWSLRQYFQYKKSLKDCLPTDDNSSLRVMLLFSYGTLCLMDGIDAGYKSGGNALLFVLRLNIIAWFRFVMLVLKEVLIRLGIKESLQKTIDSFKRINEALVTYLRQLENIDIQRFAEETRKYDETISMFSSSKTAADLNQSLLDNYEVLEIVKPWKGEFDEHMADKEGTLYFR